MENMLNKKKQESASVLFNAAVAIGDHLHETAFHSSEGNTCNWLGRRDIEEHDIAPNSIRTAALSPELYSGSGGISLFLIELYGVTKNKKYKELALKAWFRSVHYMRTNDFPATPLSFYAGQLGLVFIGYRMLELTTTSVSEIKAEINWMIGNVLSGLDVKHSLDIIGGNAGAIAPLLLLSNKYDIPSFKKLAIKCADEIIDQARWKNETICFWASPKIHGVELEHPPLTGYSHGASGLGLALLEVFHVTGDIRYLKHARGAFAFEEELYNDEEGNWVDTRYPYEIKNGKITGTYRYAWCHGAPGNVLAYMRASRLDFVNRSYFSERAMAAMKTTMKKLREKMTGVKSDATLCHGVCGLLDIAHTYGLNDQNEHLLDEVKELTASYLNHFADLIQAPSGLTTHTYSPCLMVGVSGIGLHCLRMLNPEIPSVLIIQSS